MSLQDPRADYERQVQMYLEQIRRGGTPPFQSSPAWEEAQRRIADPSTMMLQLLLGRTGRQGRVASNIIGAIQPAQQLLGILMGRSPMRWENGPDVMNSPMLMRMP